MAYLKNFIFNPGGENESSSAIPDDKQGQKEAEQTAEEKEAVKEDKPIIEKIREALQDWSNKDQADQDFDDTRV